VIFDYRPVKMYKQLNMRAMMGKFQRCDCGKAECNVPEPPTELDCDILDEDWCSSNESMPSVYDGAYNSSCSTTDSFNDLSQDDTDDDVDDALLDLGGLPSVGSAGHAEGRCQPCTFFRRGMCLVGRSCKFCHYHAGESLAAFRARVAEANQATASKASGDASKVKGERRLLSL